MGGHEYDIRWPLLVFLLILLACLRHKKGMEGATLSIWSSVGATLCLYPGRAKRSGLGCSPRISSTTPSRTSPKTTASFGSGNCLARLRPFPTAMRIPYVSQQYIFCTVMVCLGKAENTGLKVGIAALPMLPRNLPSIIKK